MGYGKRIGKIHDRMRELRENTTNDKFIFGLISSCYFNIRSTIYRKGISSYEKTCAGHLEFALYAIDFYLKSDEKNDK